MNDMTIIPTVEQINLEHRLANCKVAEAVQHATNCGLMLLQVKASKQHGEWLPWLNGEIESGRLKVGTRQVQRYIKLASNTTRESFFVEAPTIRAALELLSDKEPTEQQGELIDVEAERQAREAAEAKAEAERQSRLTAEQRSEEFRTESNERRKTIRDLESQITLLKDQPKPNPVIIEKAPDDYEEFKQTAERLQQQTADLQTALDALRNQQSRMVNDQVRAKLQERKAELAEMETKNRIMEEQVARKKAYLDSLDSEAKRLETHHEVINGDRLGMINLAAFLSDCDPISDSATIHRWLALAQMHDEAAKSIRMMFGSNRPDLTVICGGKAE